MASVQGRQKPSINLKGVDPTYNPTTSEAFWEKDALLNNCSLSVISNIRAISKWDKFLAYFWNHKGESCDLQTPGALMISLSSKQRAEINIAEANGFKRIHTFPSCHYPYYTCYIYIQNNPIMEATMTYKEDLALQLKKEAKLAPAN